MVFDAKTVLDYLSQYKSKAMSEKKKTPPDTSDEKYPEITPYPAKDDVYNQDEIEQDVDPDDPTKFKYSNIKEGARNEKDFEEDMTGEDLDVPGNEDDESSRVNGKEDEENNYYSQGQS